MSPDRIPHPAGSIPLVLGLVALAGALCVAMPFWGDQALFTVYGRELADGAVLYRDVFDVKQPGIFVFYTIGGMLFGFTEIGIHVSELAYWLGFSIFALVATRPYFSTRWGAPLVPVFTVVVYYLSAGMLELTQIEILVAFPILVAWWLVDRADPETREGVKRFAAAGIAAAAVVLLKHLYLLIVLAFIVRRLLRSRRAGASFTDLRRSLVAFSIALAVPLLIVVGYFALHGQLGRIWWAYFEMSPSAQLTSPRPVSYLIFGGRRFMIGHAPVLILAVVGTVHVLRARIRPTLDLVIGMMLWGALGAIAFFIQGWPQYKWSLFTVPIGILAVVGVEQLAMVIGRLGTRPWAMVSAIGGGAAVLSYLASASERMQTRLLLGVAIGVCAGVMIVEGAARPWRAGSWLRYVFVAALGLTLGLMAITPIDKVRALVRHDLALTVRAREAYRHSWNDAYRAADEDLEALRGGDAPLGQLYVFGDPVVLLRANRPQAVPILGWGPDFLDSRAWRELEADLRSAMPQYIVVDAHAESLIRSRYPSMLQLIASRYDVAFIGASGTWYVHR